MEGTLDEWVLCERKFPQYQKKGLLINARAETALERKTFRESVLHRRMIL